MIIIKHISLRVFKGVAVMLLFPTIKIFSMEIISIYTMILEKI
jgi:hypothetical protein